MRLTEATLPALALIVSACGPRPTGLLSSDLDSVTVIVSTSGPALVEGVPAAGLDLSDFTSILPGSGVERLEIYCATGCDELEAIFRDGLEIPCEVRTAPRVRLLADQQGLSWTPRYTWGVCEGELSIEANVILHNNSDQTWRIESLRITDIDGTELASTNSGFTLTAGDRVIPWWSGRGMFLGTYLCYSWPIPARWNAMDAFLAPALGPLLPIGTAPGELPLVNGDTVWVPSRQLSVSERSTQTPSGYSLSADILNTAADQLTVMLVYPAVLRSGARFEVSGEAELVIPAGGTVTVEASARFPLRG